MVKGEGLVGVGGEGCRDGHNKTHYSHIQNSQRMNIISKDKIQNILFLCAPPTPDANKVQIQNMYITSCLY